MEERIDYQEEILKCCKKLRLSSTIAERAAVIEGGTHEEFLYKLLSSEVDNRRKTRVTKYISAAGSPRLYEFSQFRPDEVDFQDTSPEELMALNFHRVFFDYLSEVEDEKEFILSTNLEFSRWVNVLYDEQMTSALIGRLTHHCHLLLFPGRNNRLRESSINEVYRSIADKEIMPEGNMSLLKACV